jgi:hypothetical protein
LYTVFKKGQAGILFPGSNFVEDVELSKEGLTCLIVLLFDIRVELQRILQQGDIRGRYDSIPE